MSGSTGRGYPFPTYGDLSDFPTQIQALATAVDTDMDALWTRLVAGYDQPACYVRGTTVQAVANNTDVTASYGTEVYDNHGMVDLGTSATNILIVNSGIHIAVGRVSFAAVANGSRQISIVSSGPLGVLGRRSIASQAIAPLTAVVPHVFTVFHAAALSTVTLVMRQNSGGSVNSATRTLGVAHIGEL